MCFFWMFEGLTTVYVILEERYKDTKDPNLSFDYCKSFNA